MTASAPLLVVDDLRVSFGSGPVVDGVSFTLAAGECVAIVGESGSGKSVTARALLGLTGGTVACPPADARRRPTSPACGERAWRRVRGARVGLVLQDALVSLDPLRPIGREIDDALRLHTRLTPRQRRERALEAAGRGGHARPGGAARLPLGRAVGRAAPAGADRGGPRRAARAGRRRRADHRARRRGAAGRRRPAARAARRRHGRADDQPRPRRRAPPRRPRRRDAGGRGRRDGADRRGARRTAARVHAHARRGPAAVRPRRAAPRARRARPRRLAAPRRQPRRRRPRPDRPARGHAPAARRPRVVLARAASAACSGRAARPDRVAVDDVSLELRAGETLGLVGASGSGQDDDRAPPARAGRPRRRHGRAARASRGRPCASGTAAPGVRCSARSTRTRRARSTPGCRWAGSSPTR